MTKPIFSALLAALILTGAGCSTAPKQPQAETTPVQQTAPVQQQPVENKNEDKKEEPKAEIPKEVVQEQPKTNLPAEKPKPAVKEFSVTAKNWAFDPATITVKKGDVVTLVIKSIDVDHGISIPAFNIKQTLKPGETTTVEFVADKVGNHTFFCSVFCGAGHKEMKGTLIVTE